MVDSSTVWEKSYTWMFGTRLGNDDYGLLTRLLFHMHVSLSGPRDQE